MPIALFSAATLGIVFGILFRAYALLIASPLVFIGGMLLEMSAGRSLVDAAGSGLILMVVHQLGYLLGAVGDALLRRR